MELIIMDGDTVKFSIVGAITLPPTPETVIKASGLTTINGKKVGVEGDEEKVEIPNCSYTIPSYTVPGSGILTIQSLAPNQLTQKAKSGNKRLLLKGTFIALFKVGLPAKQPPPTNLADVVTQYGGTGELLPNNNKIKAS